MAFTLSSNLSTARCYAGEPMFFSYQPTQSAVPEDLTNRSFVFALYDSASNTSEGYFPATIVTGDDPMALWTIDGSISEALRGRAIAFEIAERTDSTDRDVIATGTLTVLQSAPYPTDDDPDTDPKSRYIIRITRDDDPATISAPTFNVAYVAYNPSAGSNPVTLDALTIDPTSSYTDQVATLTIHGKTEGSTVTAVSSDGTALTVVDNIIHGTFHAPGVDSIILTETFDNASNSPKTTTVPVTLIQLVILNALTLDTTTATVGTSFTATISGKSSGSTITATASDGTALTVDGTTISGTFTSAGSPTITLVETLAGAVYSPKTSTIAITVAEAIAAPLVVAFAGSSSPYQYLIEGSGATPDDRVTVSDDGINYTRLESGRFGVEAGRQIADATSRSVRFIRGGVGGSTLAGWEADSSTERASLVSRINASNETVNALLLQVGYNDVINGTSTANRAALLRSLISKIRAETSLPSLTVFIGQTQDSTGNLTTLRYQREAEMQVANNDANVRFAFSTYDLPTEDGIHQTEASQVRSAARFAAQFNAYIMATPQVRGAKFVSTTAVSDTITDCSLVHGQGSDFTGTSGISIFDNNGNSITVTSIVRKDATTVRVTHASKGSAAGSMIYMPDGGPDDDVVVFHDNSTLLLPFDVTVEALTVGASVVVAPLTITGTPPATATVGTAYTFTPTITGGDGSAKTIMLTGTLPAGLSFNSTTGAITGTPTTTGTTTGLSITVADTAGSASLSAFSITVASATATPRVAKVNLKDSDPITVADSTWNNCEPASNIALKDTSGASTTWILDATPVAIASQVGRSTTNNSGVYPDAVLLSNWYWDQNFYPTIVVTLSGLDNTKTYKMDLFGSRRESTGRIVDFTLNGVTKQLDTSENTTQIVTFDDIAPTSGSVAFHVAADAASTTTYTYLGVIVITEYA